MIPQNTTRWRILVTASFLCLATTVVVYATDLRITSIRVTNNDVRLNWNAPGGSNYVVQTITPLSSNFVDLSPSNFVPSGADQSLSYTHIGAQTSAASRFYRVRSFPPPSLKIQPTNAMIAPGMTNRFKVLFVNSDYTTTDVTTNASLSITSLNTTVAQFARITTNGFAAVRGISHGIASIRASYQGITNTITLTVSNLTGGMYTVPASFSGYVEGQTSSVTVFGVFGSRTNNITAAADLGGFAASATRVSYNVAADVANSFALVTGQSATNDSIVFTAGSAQTSPIPVTWCKFVDAKVQPALIQVRVGETQQVSIVGYVGNGTTANALGFDTTFLYNTNLARIETYASFVRIIGLAPGNTGFNAYVNNGAGCAILTASGSLTVNSPPIITNQPADQVAIVGEAVNFAVFAGGSAPLSFQWQSNGTNIFEATNSLLTISNAGFADEAPYRVIVSNSFGGATSSVAKLTMVFPGVPLWTNRYNGPAGGYDEAQAIAIDSNGDISVTGYSPGTGGSSDFSTIKYSSAGIPMWTNRYNGPLGSNAFAVGIATDSSNNVIVLGEAIVSGGFYDLVTIKYSDVGLPLWTNRYNGPGNNSDYAHGIAVDAADNAFVTGSAAVTGGTTDFTTIKYSSSGVALWTNRYNGPGNGNDEPRAIAIDPAGNVFVAGSGTVSGGTSDFVTIKYSGAGAPLWTNRYNGPGNSYDTVNAIALDSGGNVFVAGSATGVGGTGDFVTIKYSNSGTPMWTNRYNGAFNSADEARSIAVDSSSNVIVAGYTTTGSGRSAFLTVKYSNGGLPLWTNLYVGRANSQNYAQAIALDGSGNAFVSGYSVTSSGTYDYATINYSAAGAMLWLSRYDGNSPFGAAVDGAGNVFVAGGGKGDYATIKYCSGSAPLNDNFRDRFVLTGAPVATNANNDCASKETAEPNHASDNAGGSSLWWIWIAPSKGLVTITTCGSDFDTLLGVYRGTSLPGLIPITNNGDSAACGPEAVQSRVLFNVTAGSTYQIAVDGYDGSSGNITLGIFYTIPQTNDNFASRTALTNSVITVSGFNTDATKEPNEPDHAGGTGGKSLWWSWTAPASGLATVSTCGSDFDTLLAVYIGTAVDALTEVASSDDSPLCGDLAQQGYLEFAATAGETYQIAVDGYHYGDETDARSGNVVLHIQQ